MAMMIIIRIMVMTLMIFDDHPDSIIFTIHLRLITIILIIPLIEIMIDDHNVNDNVDHNDDKKS